MPLRFHLLGTAAGGGFPQWNCGCRMCTLARREPQRVRPRTQQQAAFSPGGERWFLLGASPDLREQMLRFPPLCPRGRRATPVAGVVLLGADLDGVLGLLLLREFTALTVYATAPVRRALEANTFTRMLQRVPGQLTWVEMAPGVPFPLGEGLVATPIALGSTLPHYAADNPVKPGEAASVGLVLQQQEHTLVYTPGVPLLTPELLAAYAQATAIALDGTFWADTELRDTHPGTPLAREIGHQPLGGPDGSLAALAPLAARTRVLVHINNTNPVLDPASPEHAEAAELGWEIAADGWHLAW